MSDVRKGEPDYSPTPTLAPTGSGNSGRGVRTGSGFADDDEIRDLGERIMALSKGQVLTLSQYLQSKQVAVET